MKKIPQLFIAAVAALSAAVSQAVTISTIKFDADYGIKTDVPSTDVEGVKTYTADAGATVSFTAVGANFECWFDGAGNPLGTNPTLTFQATTDITIIPFFGKVPWQFIKYKTSSGTNYGVITNMYGSLPTDYKTADNLSLSASDSGYLSVSYVPILDLTGPMSLADGTACSIKRSAYQKGPKWPSGLTEYRLPPLLSTTHNNNGGMSYSAFGSRHVKIVLSDDNVISELGSSAFADNQGLAGDYVFTNLTTLGGIAFRSTLITSCVLGEKVKTIPDRAFYKCESLTNLVCLSSDTLYFKERVNGTQCGAANNCTNLTDYTFYCVPSFGSGWNNSSKKDRQVRFHIPRSGTDWDAIIASDGFEKWADSSEEDKAAYNAAFPNGPTPVGYYTGANVGAWIVFQSSGEAAAAELDVVSDKGILIGEVSMSDDSVAYGNHEGITGPMTCTVTSQFGLDEDGTSVYKCTGWKTQVLQDGNWVDVDSGTGLSYTFEPQGNEIVQLTWNWELVGCKVDVPPSPEGCSVNVQCETPEGYDVAGFYKAGSTFTARAVGENFYRWYGLPDGVDSTRATVSFTLNAPMQAFALFRGMAPWTFANGTLSNMYWPVVKATASGTRLTLSSLANSAITGTISVLDLTGPITSPDGDTEYTIVATSKPADATTPTDRKMDHLLLPPTIETIAQSTANSGLLGVFDIVFPEPTNVKTVGASALANAGLAGDLVFPNLQSTGSMSFKGSSITSIVGGPDFSYVSERSFENCTLLTNFVSQSETGLVLNTDAAHSKYAMNNCTALSEYTFYCFPDFQTGWNNGSKKGTGVRVFIPRDNEGWNTALSNEVYTGWSKCGDKQAEYYENFGDNAQKPSGYMTAPFEAWVLRFGADNGTMLMLK